MTTRELPIGHATLSLETGKLAKQADGSVIVRFGDSVVLVTACRNSSPREGIDFLPLTVDYREYTYASGRIPGGFFKREGKPSEKEVLTSRVIDRPIRPLFPAGWRFETQIIALVLSADSENDTDVLALTGASTALALSDIPFQKTIAGVRVGLIDGQYVINPTFAQRKESKLDLVVAGSKDGLVMVEAGAKEVSEEQVVGALEAAHAAIKQIVAVIDDLAKTVGKKKVTVEKKEVGSGVREERRRQGLRAARPPPCASTTSSRTTRPSTRCSRSSWRRIRTIRPSRKPTPRRSSRNSRRKSSTTRSCTTRCGSTAASSTRSGRSGSRRACCPRTHGSAVFTRGETQALVTCTLGTADDAQKIETFEGEHVEELHAPLQLPAVLGRRSRTHDRTRPPRNRPRRSR